MASAVVFSTAGTANTASTDVSPGDVGFAPDTTGGGGMKVVSTPSACQKG
jgi:hypothetical protein